MQKIVLSKPKAWFRQQAATQPNLQKPKNSGRKSRCHQVHKCCWPCRLDWVCAVGQRHHCYVKSQIGSVHAFPWDFYCFCSQRTNPAMKENETHDCHVAHATSIELLSRPQIRKKLIIILCDQETSLAVLLLELKTFKTSTNNQTNSPSFSVFQFINLSIHRRTSSNHYIYQ